MLFIIFLFISGTFALRVQPGPCPKVTGLLLDAKRGTGLWYEYAVTPDKYNNTLKCLTHKWYPAEKEVSVFTSSAFSKATGNYLEIESEATLNTTDNSVNTVSHIPLVGESQAKYWDFDIVYDSHVITWSCKNETGGHVQSSTIFTRKPYPIIDVIRRAQRIFARRGFYVPEYTKYDNNC